MADAKDTLSPTDELTAGPAKTVGAKATVACLAVRLGQDLAGEELAQVRAVIAENGGTLLAGPTPGGQPTESDVVEASFRRVSGAVTAAVTIVGVKPGVAHGGVHAAEVSGEIAADLPLARAARAVCDAAPSGAVLVSETVRAIAANMLPYSYVPTRQSVRSGSASLRTHLVVVGPRPVAAAGRRPPAWLALASIAVIGLGLLSVWWALTVRPASSSPSQTVTASATNSAGAVTATITPADLAPSGSSATVVPTGTLAVATLAGRIALVGVPHDGTTNQLFVANANGTGVSQITSDEEATVGLPSWSADGRRLVFSRESTSEIIPRIWTANADGSDAAQLVDDTYAQQPSWSPNGARIAYGRDDDTSQQGGLVLYDLATKTVSGVISVKYHPAWFPNGTRLAGVLGSPRENTDLFAFGDDGLNENQLSSTSSLQERNPQVDGTGTLIAYTQSEIRGPGDIATISVEGGPVTLLTSGPPDDDVPVWSPDGQEIIFASDRGSDHAYDIYVMTRNGGKPQLVLAMDGWDLYPGAWTAH